MFAKTVCILTIILGFISGGILAISYFAPLPILTTSTAPEIIPLPCTTAAHNPCTLATTSLPQTPQPKPVAEKAPLALFGTATALRTSKSLTFSDNLVVTLDTISDSRCKPDVQCIWAGELAPTLKLTGGSFGTSTTSVHLGSSRTPKATVKDYTLTLMSTTGQSIVLLVEKNLFVTSKIPTPTPARTLQAVSITSDTPLPISPSAADFAADISLLISKKTAELRTQKSLLAYTPNITLTSSARLYSNQLRLDNLLAHIDKNGCTLTCRFTKSGYQAQAWGENLARMEYEEQPTAEYAANFFMTQWQKSPGHLANILSPIFSEQGIGITFDEHSVYVVVHFAQPKTLSL